MIYKDITETIGNTPVVELNNIKNKKVLNSNLFAKVESFNPGGSVKDRIAKAMIEDAEKKGILKKGTTIVEPTSGNTGIGIAMVAAAKGYDVKIVMPETMSIERRQLIGAFGAEIILSDGDQGMTGAIKKAEEIKKECNDAITLSQFDNMANPQEHYRHTAVEIYNDFGKELDAVIIGVGTGGTISGVGKHLKELHPEIKVVAVEPASSPVLSEGHSGSHKIQGIGAGFIPKTLDTSVYDEVIKISNEEAYEGTQLLAAEEGILSGISAGSVLAAAIKKDQDFSGKNILIILPDTGERYLSTGVFEG